MGATKEQREAGRAAREMLIGFLEREQDWDALSLEKATYLVPRSFVSGSKKVLARYSHGKGGQWWYDVKDNDWEHWDDDMCLALLLADDESLSFVLLDPRTTEQLLDRIEPKGRNAKQIHVQRHETTGKPIIAEWKTLALEEVVITGRGIQSPLIKTPGRKINRESIESLEEVVKRVKERVQEIKDRALNPSESPATNNKSANQVAPVTPVAREESRDITDLVERSFDVEQALKIDLFGIYAKITSQGYVTLNGQIRTCPSEQLPPDLNLIITFHDAADRVLHVVQENINLAGLPGSQVFSVEWIMPAAMTENPHLSRIRIQPGIRSDGMAGPSRRGLMKKIFGWIKG